MPADQAAGLRRRALAQPRCIHCVSASATASPRLAKALQGQGWHVLLVDTENRLTTQAPARSLFDWRRQLTRGQPNTLPVAYGAIWSAPGLRADAAGLAAVAWHHDCLLLDRDIRGDAWAPMPDASNLVVIETSADVTAMQYAYALIKTVFSLRESLGIILLGDVRACRRLHAAAMQFAGPVFAQTVANIAGEVDPFATLAVRMAGEEKGRRARY